MEARTLTEEQKKQIVNQVNAVHEILEKAEYTTGISLAGSSKKKIRTKKPKPTIKRVNS